jgi:asparagine synthase (glutamine-hydrolysing)
MRTHELPKLLRYEDRNSMAHSLEARVPFLDIRLVELVSSLDGDWLFRDGQTKSVLRHALSDLLPAEVLNRHDKMGFVAPEQRFFRGRLGEFAADVFASPEFQERGFVNAGEAKRVLHEQRAGGINAGPDLWRALNLELWARRSLGA